MSERRLPEELLHRILSMHFARVPETFCSNDYGQRFYRHRVPAHPTSNAILVSKRWLRIGTSLLYEFLSITTTHHEEIIAGVFRAHPGLAKAVRHVRLRGGYGKELKEVLKQTTNIRSVSVLIMVKSRDSVAGLVRSLPLLDPTVLYLRIRYGKRSRFNKKQEEIISTIETAIVDKWTSLALLHVAQHSEVPRSLYAAIRRSSSLREVFVHGDDVNRLLWSNSITTISENKNIVRILYRGEIRHPESNKIAIERSSISPEVMDLLAEAEKLPAEEWLNQPMHVPAAQDGVTLVFS